MNDDPDLAGRAYEWLGPCLAFQGAPIDDIRHSLFKAYEYAKQIGNRHLEAGSLQKIAYLFILQGEGNPEQSEEYFCNGLQIMNEIGIVQQQVIGAGHLGWHYVFTGDYDKAIHYLSEAEEKAARSQLTHFYARRQQIFASLYIDLGDYERAEQYLDNALSEQSENPSPTKHLQPLGCKGLIKYLQGALVESLTNLDKAIVLARNFNDTRQLAWNLKRKGIVLIALKRYAEAEKSLLEAIEIQQSLRQWNRALMGVAGLADLALAQEDFETACQLTERILTHLKKSQLDATDESLAVFMSAYHVLKQNGR